MPQMGMFYVPPPKIEPIPGDRTIYAVLADGIKVGEVEHDWRGWHHDLSDERYADPVEAATALVAERTRRGIPRGKGTR